MLSVSLTLRHIGPDTSELRKTKVVIWEIDNDNPNFLRVVSRKYTSSGILVQTDMVAAFPINMTFITDDSETNP